MFFRVFFSSFLYLFSYLFSSFFYVFPLVYLFFSTSFIKVGNLLAQYRIKRLAVITCSLKNVCIPMKLKWKSLQWSLFAQDKQVHLDKKEMVGLAKNEGRDKLTQRELSLCVLSILTCPSPLIQKFCRIPCSISTIAS